MVEPEATPRTRRAAVPDRMLTYEIGFDDGRIVRVEIPSAYKITFGPIAGVKGYEGGGMAFRAWENETRQRLLYRSVAYFRDLTIPAMVKCVRKFGSETWFPDDGKWTGAKAGLVEKAWKSTEDPAYLDHEPGETAPAEDDIEPWANPVPRRILKAR